MADSKFKVCSLALIELGVKPISSFDDNTPASRICGDIWEDYSSYLLSIYPWRFSMHQMQLASLVMTPLVGWQHAFKLPANFLSLRSVYAGQGGSPLSMLNYEIFQDNIYANSASLYIQYQAYVEPINWPAWFLEFAVQALAAKLAPMLLDKQNVSQFKYQNAFGYPQDNGNGGLFGRAKTIDSKQMPAEQISSFDLLAGRFM
jgi:hypothetical protein